MHAASSPAFMSETTMLCVIMSGRGGALNAPRTLVARTCYLTCFRKHDRTADQAGKRDPCRLCSLAYAARGIVVGNSPCQTCAREGSPACHATCKYQPCVRNQSELAGEEPVTRLRFWFCSCTFVLC